LKIQKLACDLQVHPFGNKIKAIDILRQMERNGLDLVCLLDFSWHKLVDLYTVMFADEELDFYYKVDMDFSKKTYRFINKKTRKRLFIILGREVAPLDQSWHILSIGVTYIQNLHSVEGIIDEILEKGGIAIFDHPYVDACPSHRFRDISSEKELELTHVCSKYLNRIALEWNGLLIPWVRSIMPNGYDDLTNKKTSVLAEILRMPLVTTTDLHAWNRRMLKPLGTARIVISSGNIDENNALDCLKRHILEGHFETNKKYVSFLHFLEVFLHSDWLKRK